MSLILGAVLILSGALMLLAGPRLARERITLRFSPEDLQASSGSRHRGVRRAVWGAVAVNEAIAAFWLYLGVRFLAG